MKIRGRRRVSRLDLDQARERIRTIARALRTAQDFDLLRIKERSWHADTAQVDVVD